jgi:hypothetical protein
VDAVTLMAQFLPFPGGPAREWRAIGIAAFLCYATARLAEFRPSALLDDS